MLAWFRIFIGHKEPNNVDQQQSGNKDRSNSEMTMEIDFSTCKRYGASYRALPKTFNQPKCSGRSALCKEVILFELTDFIQLYKVSLSIVYIQALSFFNHRY